MAYTRSSSVEIVPEGSQIVVQVGREEKIICGLTKYTTCSEIIQAITEDHAAKTGCNSFLLGHHREYCIVEKWGDFEHVLLPCTKILKLWRAWGREQINVNFELVKVDAHLHLPLWICDETKITNSLERNYEFNLGPKIQTLPLDKRKRIIRKAFRKLEKMKKGIDFQDKNNLESCIHTVVSQDHTIKQQIQRIEELDREIEFKEACLHLEKMDSIRENYDQNPYLKSSDPYTKNSKNKTENIFPEHKKIQNELIHLEEQLNHLQVLIRNLSDEIEEEISSTCMEIDKERDYSDGDENKLEECDVNIVKQELDESLQAALQLHYHYECVLNQIKYNELMLLSQEKEFKSLEHELKSLSSCDTNILNFQSYLSSNNCTSVNSSNLPSDFHIALCNLDVLETNSDTGISSSQSQDSEPTS